MSNENLAQEILEKINKEHIKPTPKWRFELKSVFIWLLIFVSLLIGSSATSVVIFMFDNNQWDLYDHVSGNMLAFILATLPYFWLIILGAFIYFVYINFKNTQRGYRYNAFLIVSGGIMASVVFGLIFYNLGFGQAIDDVFENKAPLYHQLINTRPRMFYRPDDGILPGRIIEIINPEQFTLDDFNRQHWLIIKDYQIYDLPLHEGQTVIIIGDRLNKFEFKAYDIRVLKPQKQQHNKLPHILKNE